MNTPPLAWRVLPKPPAAYCGQGIAEFLYAEATNPGMPPGPSGPLGVASEFPRWGTVKELGYLSFRGGGGFLAATSVGTALSLAKNPHGFSE